MRMSDWSSDVCSSDLRHSFLVMNIARAADATIARAEYILARYVISTDKDVGRLYQSDWRRAGLQLELLARQVRDSPQQTASVAQLRLAYRERGREPDALALRTSYDQNSGSRARIQIRAATGRE